MTEREKAYNAAIARETYRAMVAWRNTLLDYDNEHRRMQDVYAVIAKLEYVNILRRERGYPAYDPNRHDGTQPGPGRLWVPPKRKRKSSK